MPFLEWIVPWRKIPWIRVPDVVGMTVEEGIRSLEEGNFEVEQIGDGTH